MLKTFPTPPASIGKTGKLSRRPLVWTDAADMLKRRLKQAGLPVRLESGWETDYKVWSQRDLSAKRYVYWWADGVYFNVRLDEERTCVLVLIGATEDGSKELLAVVDGYRESTQSWRELLGQLKRLGLSAAPKLATGDGSLGFWIALQEGIRSNRPAALLGP